MKEVVEISGSIVGKLERQKPPAGIFPCTVSSFIVCFLHNESHTSRKTGKEKKKERDRERERGGKGALEACRR